MMTVKMDWRGYKTSHAGDGIGIFLGHGYIWLYVSRNPLVVQQLLWKIAYL
jgi:hypothetical protein